MTDPFSRCWCGQVAERRAFCDACWARLPTPLRDRLNAAVTKGDHVGWRQAMTEARAALA